LQTVTKDPGGMCTPPDTNAFAAMSVPAPILAPLRIVASMPTSTSSPTVQPWSMALHQIPTCLATYLSDDDSAGGDPRCPTRTRRWVRGPMVCRWGFPGFKTSRCPRMS
jgi:hypothetical protein